MQEGTSSFIPSHYGSMRSLLKTALVSYIKGIDVIIRVIGTCIIIAIVGFLIRMVAALFCLLPFVTLEVETLAGIITLVLLPLILRVAVLGGGFTVPPIIWRKKAAEQVAASDR